MVKKIRKHFKNILPITKLIPKETLHTQNGNIPLNIAQADRVSLNDSREIESYSGIKKYKDKDHELTWVIKDIKRNYLIFRERFLKYNSLGLY